MVTKAYAMFTDLRLANYTFFVTSENDNGTAGGPATKLFVPHYDKSKNNFLIFQRYIPVQKDIT